MKKSKNVVLNLFVLDIREGILYQWKKAALFFALLLLCIIDFCFYVENERLNTAISGFDCVFYVFSGNLPYTTTGSKFILPYIWIFVNCYIAFLVGDYPVSCRRANRYTIVIATCNKVRWWISKCVWVMLLNIFIYLVIYSMCFLSPFLISSNNNFEFNINLFKSFFNTGVMPSKGFKWNILILPMLVSITSSICQFFISVLANSTIAYLMTISCHVFAVFIYSPVLVPNYSMLIRNRQVGFNGMMNSSMVLIMLSSVFFLCFFGYLIYRDKDII